MDARDRERGWETSLNTRKQVSVLCRKMHIWTESSLTLLEEKSWLFKPSNFPSRDPVYAMWKRVASTASTLALNWMSLRHRELSFHYWTTCGFVSAVKWSQLLLCPLNSFALDQSGRPAGLVNMVFRQASFPPSTRAQTRGALRSLHTETENPVKGDSSQR